MKRSRCILLLVLLLLPISIWAQLNTDRITAIGRNALYFDDYVLSIQYFNQVIKLKPYLAEPYQLRAIAKIQLSDYEGALRDLNASIERNPFQPGSFYARGYVYRQLGEFEKAEADFNEALVFSPENKTYMLLRADCRAMLRRYEEAQADIDRLLRREPTSASLYFEQGIICLQSRDTLGAVTAFSSAVKYSPREPQHWSALGVAHLQAGSDDEGLAAISEAIRLGSTYAGDYINRGIIYYHKHNYRAALQDYDEAVRLDPKDPQCFFNRGVLREEVGDYNRAYDDMTEALTLTEIYPTAANQSLRAPILYQRGMVSQQLQQWKAVLEDMQALISDNPTFLPAYYTASRAATAMGNKRQAAVYMQQAYEMETTPPDSSPSKGGDTEEGITREEQIAHADTVRRDYRRLFSQRAAQNGEADSEEQHYRSATRGRVQDRTQDAVPEPSIALAYYSQTPAKFHYLLDEFNSRHLLPAALRATTNEMPLTAELVSHHFAEISRLSAQLDGLPDDLRSVPTNESQRLALLFFERAIELATVQDYTSAIEDCSKALSLCRPTPPAPDLQGRERPTPDPSIKGRGDMSGVIYFCQAVWREREYISLNYSEGVRESGSARRLIMMDYDWCIRLLPEWPFAYYNKANLLCAQKDYEAAISYYDEAIKRDTDFAEAYFNRGLTLLFIGKHDEGLADLSHAGELGLYQAYNLITLFR